MPDVRRPERVADAAVVGKLRGSGLRKIDLADDYRPRLEIVTGIVARKGNATATQATHPLTWALERVR